jgi:hypothetical protein
MCRRDEDERMELLQSAESVWRYLFRARTHFRNRLRILEPALNILGRCA